MTNIYKKYYNYSSSSVTFLLAVTKLIFEAVLKPKTWAILDGKLEKAEIDRAETPLGVFRFAH